jgi:RsiW-degrading membrane proteinase PrsW (M82 family)
MSQDLTYLGLNIIGFILIIKWFKEQIRDYKSIESKQDFFVFKRFQSVFYVLMILTIPLLLINYTDIEVANHLPIDSLKKNHHFYAIITSLFISLVWLRYILKLDIFDKEKKRYLILIFILSTSFTLLARFPYSFIHNMGITDSTTNTLQSFIYSIFGIGLVEETIKFIPFLILLRFTGAIDEPYDYILYASVSALGFAFVENSIYLNNYGLHIIGGRALYATVAHMVFSSTLAYGLFLIKFKHTKIHPVLTFIAFYLLAIFFHGFYDFWIMNKSVSAFSGLTTLFLLLGVHLWFKMSNNTINASNYYSKEKTLNNDGLKKYLTFGLLSILMFSYLYIAFKNNSKEANSFLLESVFVYGYLIFYLIATLTRYDIMQGVLLPIHINLKNIIPQKKKK